MLKESNSTTKAKPAEHPYTRISKKINIKLACTGGPGFPSTKIAPTEHFYEKFCEKRHQHTDFCGKTLIAVSCFGGVGGVFCLKYS